MSTKGAGGVGAWPMWRLSAEQAEVVDGLAQVLTKSAPAAEKERQLPVGAYEAMIESGIFRMLLPTELGGWDVDPVAEMEIYEALSRADVSGCWNVTAGCLNTSWAAAYLSDEAVQRILSSEHFVVAGQALPKGAGRRVPGGYRVTGRYSLGSGMSHAAWVQGGFVGTDDGEPPDPKVFVVPKDEVNVLDNWHALGILGSNSVDYDVEDVFVPDGYWFSMMELAAQRGGPRFEAPIAAQVAASHSGLAVGGARRALDEVVEQSRTRPALASSVPFHRELGRAYSRLHAARDRSLILLERLAGAFQGGRPVNVDPEHLVDLAATGTFTIETAVEVAHTTYRYGGSSVLRSENPLQQVLRDLLVAQQHKFNDATNYDRLGQSLVESAARDGEG